MTPSNATAIEELESATDLSCSPQCTECRECLSDPKTVPGFISSLEKKLSDFQDGSHLGIVVEFKQLEVLLLKLHIHLSSAAIFTIEVAMAQVIAINHILHLYGLCMTSHLSGLSVWTTSASFGSIHFCVILGEILAKVARQDKQTWSSPWERAFLEVFGRHLLEKYAQPLLKLDLGQKLPDREGIDLQRTTEASTKATTKAKTVARRQRRSRRSS